MKSSTLMALAVAGTFAAGGAFAGGMHHGTKHGSSFEVATPSSVNESAPWLASQPHSSGWSSHDSSSTVAGMQDSLHSDAAIGASADLGGSGHGGFDSTSLSGFDSSLSGLDYSLSGVDYWLWGADIEGTGASSGAGGSGSGGFDSMSSFSDSSFDVSLSADDSSGGEQYLVWGPLSEIGSGDLSLVEADSESYSPVTLSALSEGYTLLTPIYDEMADASSVGDAYQVSQYSPLSGGEDIAT